MVIGPKEDPSVESLGKLKYYWITHISFRTPSPPPPAFHFYVKLRRQIWTVLDARILSTSGSFLRSLFGKSELGTQLLSLR